MAHFYCDSRSSLPVDHRRKRMIDEEQEEEKKKLP